MIKLDSMPAKKAIKLIAWGIEAISLGVLLSSVLFYKFFSISDPGTKPALFRVIQLSLAISIIGYGILALQYKSLRPIALLRRIIVGSIWLENRCFAGVFLLIAGNLFLRAVLEQADRHLYNYYELVFPEIVNKIDSFPWWKVFIPGYSWEGAAQYTGYYSPISAILMLYLPTKLGPANTWYLLNIFLIIVTFVISWFAFHSRVFSYTLCVLLGFGTQLYQIYHIPGTTTVIISFIFYEINLFLILKIFTDSQRKRLWYALYFIEFVVMALYNLSWLDYLAFVWVLCLLLLVYFWYAQQKINLFPLAYIFSVSTFVGLLYIFIKSKFAGNQITAAGTEEDLVFNYPYLILAVEDIISNLITNFYLAVSNFLPPFMIGSNSQFLYGPDQLVALQNGYHADKSYLIPMQHMFFWRYYAGIWFAGFIYMLVRFTKKAFSTASFDYLALTIFTLMTLLSSPTHLIIKARPYLSTPLLTYRVVLGVLGVALLIAYLTMLVWKKLKNRRLAVIIVLLVWVVILSGALTRPPYLEFFSQQVGIAYYAAGPNPMNTLLMILNQLWLIGLHILRF